MVDLSRIDYSHNDIFVRGFDDYMTAVKNLAKRAG